MNGKDKIVQNNNFSLFLFFLRFSLCPLFFIICGTPYALGINAEDNITTAVIKNFLLGELHLEPEQKEEADKNKDTEINVADIVFLINPTPSPSPTPEFTPTPFISPTPSPIPTPTPFEISVNLPGDVPLVLVKIPAGSFLMGSPKSERGRYSWEWPVHTVNINYDFYVSKYEITQKQWLSVMGNWPSAPPESYYGLGDNFPAYNISWNDCQGFITALNNHVTATSQGPATFRLLSESEWEYSCRAGAQTRFYYGDSLDCDDLCEDCSAGNFPGNRTDYMWYCGNNIAGTPQNGTKEVGQKLPNAFGLYDMHGNVWEWCQDFWHSDYYDAPSDGSAWEYPVSNMRIFRGGSWRDYIYSMRSADRDRYIPEDYNYTKGFRLAMKP